jgi:hypothetical protein
MFDLKDYNACKIEFEKSPKDGTLVKYTGCHLKFSPNGLSLTALISACEEAKEKGYGRGVLYGRRAVKAKWEKILIITL